MRQGIGVPGTYRELEKYARLVEIERFFGPVGFRKVVRNVPHNVSLKNTGIFLHIPGYCQYRNLVEPLVIVAFEFGIDSADQIEHDAHDDDELPVIFPISERWIVVRESQVIVSGRLRDAHYYPPVQPMGFLGMVTEPLKCMAPTK